MHIVMALQALYKVLHGTPFCDAIPAPLLSGAVLFLCQGSCLLGRGARWVFVSCSVLS